MDSKYRKLFVIKRVQKCTKISLVARLCPDPLGERISFHRLPSHNGGLLIREGGSQFLWVLSMELIRWTQVASGTAGRANIRLCRASSISELYVSHYSDNTGW